MNRFLAAGAQVIFVGPNTGLRGPPDRVQPLDDAAVLVNPENVFDIARGMKLILLDEALRQTLIKKGMEQVAKFSWKVAAEKVLETYRHIAAGRSRVAATI